MGGEQARLVSLRWRTLAPLRPVDVVRRAAFWRQSTSVTRRARASRDVACPKKGFWDSRSFCSNFQKLPFESQRVRKIALETKSARCRRFRAGGPVCPWVFHGFWEFRTIPNKSEQNHQRPTGRLALPLQSGSVSGPQLGNVP